MAAKRIGLSSKGASKDESAVKTNNWENRSRGYMKSAPEIHMTRDYDVVYEDDASTKKIMMVDERDMGMEMGRIGAKSGR